MRLVVLGRGAAGKSTFARELSEATGVPCIELDRVFWSADLTPTPRTRWVAEQEELTAADTWILDGDLGPYDAVEVRLHHADTVVLFDFPAWRCAWRAGRRSRERLDFWTWLVTWRRRHRPELLRAVETHASGAEVITVRTPADVRRTTRMLGTDPPRR